MSNIYYWEKPTDVLKTCRKSIFLGEKIWRNAVALKNKKVQAIFGETFILALLSSAVFRLQSGSRYENFLPEFLRKWGWFQGHNERFPDILAKN